MKLTAYDGATTRAHNHGRYDNIEKGWYFRFDDQNKMSYEYILSIA